MTNKNISNNRYKREKKVNGDGSYFYDDTNDRWICKFYIHDCIDGKAMRKSVYGKTKREAAEKFRKIMYESNEKNYTTRHGIPIVEIMKHNINRKYNSNTISAGYYARVNDTIRVISKSKIANLFIQDITAEQLQNYMNSLIDTYRDSSIKKVWEQFYQAFETAIKEDYIPKNPMLNVTKPKSRIASREIKSLTVEDQMKFANYLFKPPIEKENFKNVFLIQMFCGLRIGETLTLSLDNIDLDNNLIYVDKTLTIDKDGKLALGNKTKTYAGKRYVPIPPFLKKYIKEQLDYAKTNGTDFLFTYDNHLVHPHSMNTQLHRMMKNLNIPAISTHALRHTFATRSIEGGINPSALQKIMGHADIKVTLNTYTTVFEKFKINEAEKINQYYLSAGIVDSSILDDLDEKGIER